jgi:hypothetical protein
MPSNYLLTIPAPVKLGDSPGVLYMWKSDQRSAKAAGGENGSSILGV